MAVSFKEMTRAQYVDKLKCVNKSIGEETIARPVYGDIPNPIGTMLSLSIYCYVPYLRRCAVG